MRIGRNVRLSFRAFSTHRLRAALAVAGTAVGVGGVLVSTAIGEGARGEVLRRIESLGRNVLVVSASMVERRAGRAIEGDGWSRDLRTEDARAIVRGARAVVRAAPAQDRGMRAKLGPVQNPTTVLGTTPEWQVIRQFSLTRGRFFTHEEDARRARVAVLGYDAYTNLFPDSVEPVGRTIRIGSVPFRVIGVLASKGVSVDGSATEDDRIVIPLQTALRRLFNVDRVKMIYLEAVEASAMEEAEAEAAAILRARHDVRDGARDGFTIQNQRVLLAAELATRTSFQRLIAGLGLLSLFVGGTGILSIMLLSIRERRPEIGLRVAVGARRRDIVAQFLAEALLLAAAGGTLGILAGAAAAGIVSTLTTWDARLSALPLIVTTLSVVAIGLLFGVLPAWGAARLDVVEALRAE